MNTEYRTSNIERRMGKEEETEIAVECSVLDIRFSFDVERSMFDVHLFDIWNFNHSTNSTKQIPSEDNQDRDL